MRAAFSPLSTLCNCGQSHGARMSRRTLLAGAGAAFACAATPLAGFLPKAYAQAKGNIIDVHHHISPPSWVAGLKSVKMDSPPVTNWTVEKTLEDMDKGGVGVAITSPTTPQASPFDAPTAARIARESNEFAKKLETSHPGRFGTWAMLPLPHVAESLKEIEYAFDTLKVDGVGVMTSYGDKWLGYTEFEPVWQELNRRKATVYTHPTNANCCVNLVRDIDPALIEFGTDTTRSIFTVIFSGFGEKYPDINWIWSHGGGSVTAFYERFTVQSIARPPFAGKVTRAQIETQLRRFYYDTAAIPNDVTLSALAKMVPASQIVFGTDYPYRRAAEYIKPLESFFKPEEVKAISRDNALKLVPRLKTA